MWLEIIIFLALILVVYEFIAWFFKSKKSKIELQFNTTTLCPFSSSSTSGQRQYMEDRMLIRSNLLDDKRASFYAVFDGHGGNNAADFCVEHMAEYLLQDPLLRSNPIEALVNVFQLLDKSFLAYANSCFPAINDGTTVISVLIKDSTLYISNLGDSRAVLIQSDYTVVPLSDDHKPHRADEVQRIQSLGGAVLFHNGVWRVNGILAVSRAIGDQLLKPYVSSVPDIQVKPISTLDHFILLGSDGLFDVLPNKVISSIIETHMSKHSKKGKRTSHQVVQHQFQSLSKALVEAAIDAGSTDNISCIVVDISSLASLPPTSSSSSSSDSNVAVRTPPKEEGSLSKSSSSTSLVVSVGNHHRESLLRFLFEKICFTENPT